MIRKIQIVSIAFIFTIITLTFYEIYYNNYFVALFTLLSIIFVPICLGCLIGLIILFYHTFKVLQDKYYKYIIKRLALEIDAEQKEIRRNLDILNGDINGHKEQN